VGSLNGRIRKLEGRMPDLLQDLDEDEKLRRQRAITRMVLAEYAHDHDLHAAVRRVVDDQYEDLSQESRQYIAESWTETIRSWTRLDWMISAGQDGP
jgi:hypothetical protein